MNNKLTPDQSSNALEFDLFQGDFGSPDDCELTNKIVISRGDYKSRDDILLALSFLLSVGLDAGETVKHGIAEIIQ